MISISSEENAVIQDYLQKEVISQNKITFIIRDFVNGLNKNIGIINISLPDIDKFKGKEIDVFLVAFPITDNKFCTVENIVSILRKRKIIPKEMVFIEKQSDKVAEWIRTELPIFHTVPIFDIVNMESKLCRIIWRQDEKKT